MMEWRRVPSWPEYEVSAYGDVRRVVERGGHVGLRKPYLTNGYLYLAMRDNGCKSQAVGVHRLVAEAFLGPGWPGAQVAHFDGNKTNNHFSNLRYTDRAGNERDKVRHGRSNRGERQGRAVLTRDAVRQIRERLKSQSQSVVAREFGVARPTIASIVSGRSWAWLK